MKSASVTVLMTGKPKPELPSTVAATKNSNAMRATAVTPNETDNATMIRDTADKA